MTGDVGNDEAEHEGDGDESDMNNEDESDD